MPSSLHFNEVLTTSSPTSNIFTPAVYIIDNTTMFSVKPRNSGHFESLFSGDLKLPQLCLLDLKYFISDRLNVGTCLQMYSLPLCATMCMLSNIQFFVFIIIYTSLMNSSWFDIHACPTSSRSLTLLSSWCCLFYGRMSTSTGCLRLSL